MTLSDKFFLKLDALHKARNYARSLRREVIQAYGAKCVCCGESRMTFLTIDHKNNDGAKHRNELRKNGKKPWISKYGIRRAGSVPFWNDLKRRHWPQEDFQCLCYNCNMGRHRNIENPGICPHELERGEITSLPLSMLGHDTLVDQAEFPNL